MKENQELKMQLLKEFAESNEPKTVEFCREAYKFLTDDEPEKNHRIAITPNGSGVNYLPANGIYLIYGDNSYFKYSKDCNKDGVKYIGIIHDGHPFAVALKDLGRFQLLKDGVECEDESEFYLESECDALNDWKCVERTKRIQNLGTDIILEDGEYIPALPMLVAMRYWAERGLNEALKFVGGEPMNMNSGYWSVTENSSGSAWHVYFNDGYVCGTSKYGSYVVRPVAAFNL